MKALVDGDTLGEPDWPDFWGLSGNRFIVCRKGKWIHFRTGNRDHRLAYMRG